MDEDEDVEAAERWEGIPKIEKMERKMSFGEICVGEWGEPFANDQQRQMNTLFGSLISCYVISRSNNSRT